MIDTMETLSASAEGRVVALGNFDGVHVGHQALLAEAGRLGETLSLPVAVWSFASLPGEKLTTPEGRASYLHAYGADEVIYDAFDRVRDFTPERFFREVLVEALNAKACVCGFNYSFGQYGAGHAATLEALCREAGILCRVVSEVALDGEAVSSTRIRTLLREGQVEGAARLLGHPYALTGRVESGRHFGRTMGLPTLNQRFGEGICLPRRGVYATFCRVNGASYPSVTNIGCCPTVTEGRETVVETHILGFQGELYGEEVEVGFLRWLREERKFSSVEALKEEIEENCREAKRVFLNGSFLR
jgi:riboflavin kinase/FMN adenylyltransferase